MRASIIVPYNHDRGFLERCVNSIEAQTVPCELILSQSLESVAYNFNKGLELVTSEFVKVVGEDDWLPLDSIEKLLGGIGDAPWVVANATDVRGNSMYPYKPDTLDFKENVKLNRIHNGGTMYRTAVLRAIGGMNEELWTGEEYEMHLRLMSLGYLPAYLDEYVYFYRVHTDQKSKSLRRKDPDKRRKEIERIQSLYSNKV